MTLRTLGKLNMKHSSLLSIAAVCSFLLALFFHHHSRRPEIIVDKQDSAINIDSLFLKLFATGNKRLIADLLWIQTLIESDLEHYRGNPLNNWMFIRFKNISELDPMFYENYLYGGQYLSVIKDDPEAASIIMARGLEHFPDDYSLNFNQGFNYYIELGDNEKGLIHFNRIKDHPHAPGFLTSIIIKLQHEIKGDPTITLQLLYESYKKTKDRVLKQKLHSDIYSLKATIDLKCLNEGGSNCDKRDAEGNSYLQSNGVYSAPKPFLPYKIFRQAK